MEAEDHLLQSAPSTLGLDASRDQAYRCATHRWRLAAGGEIRGGQVYGSSDKFGAYPRENPVAPEGLLATIYHALGIDPAAEIRDRQGRPYKISEGAPVAGLFG